MQNFFDQSPKALEVQLRNLGKEKFRAQQLFKWVYQQDQVNPEKMTNLARSFRAEIKNSYSFALPKVKTHLKSIDGTQKFLIELEDKLTVETVAIPSDGRLTLCLSSEVGCNMACRFCFTGKQKLVRRLSASEILAQFLLARTILKDQNIRITNIVFMGMGEPLDNSDAVFTAIDILHAPFGINFSLKKITVSTSGVVPEMHKIWQKGVRLAVSLNGSNDAVREQVMPINRRWPLSILLKECRDYYDKTKDRVTFEYVLLKDVTDSLEHARQLIPLLRGIPCKINIIPFNEHPGTEYTRPSDARIEAFHRELMRLGAHVLLRRTMGRDIFAACGQLTSESPHRPTNMDISNSKIGSIYRKTKGPKVQQKESEHPWPC